MDGRVFTPCLVGEKKIKGKNEKKENKKKRIFFGLLVWVKNERKENEKKSFFFYFFAYLIRKVWKRNINLT